MTFDVILQQQPNDGYIARPVLWPDSSVHGATQAEALTRVRLLIRSLLTQTKVVQVEVEEPENQTDNPWLTKAGMFKDDPTWDDFLKTMAEYRQHLDAKTMSESV